MRLRHPGLRVRSALGFAALALVLSLALSVSTYELTRWYLLDQRESLGVRQAILNASVTKGLLSSGTDPLAAIGSAGTGSGTRAVLQVGEEWYSATVELDESKVPAGVLQLAERGESSRQLVSINDATYLVVGIPLAAVGATYVEFVSLREYERTLDTLFVVLFAAASVTTLAGACAGWLLSRRVLRPLADVAATATSMSAGDLSSRVVVTNDPDLEPVAASFNEMADSLEQRIAREMRFTADVSHELRTPLTAAGSAVNLALRTELPERAQMAMGIAAEQLDQLRRLTLELLEISRFDAGVAELSLEDTDVVELTRRVLDELGVDQSILVDHLGDHRRHLVDRTRFRRVVANLVENAVRYAGGATNVELGREGSSLLVIVDDAGPGVPVGERLAIFGRFHRGENEAAAGQPKGSGLGLALVEEHVALHGGVVSVTDSPAGGARFVVALP